MSSNNNNNNNTNNNNKRSFEEATKEDISCVVCTEIPVKSVFHCDVSSSHIICEACFDNLPRRHCPVCRGSFSISPKRNLLVERIISHLYESCPNNCGMKLVDADEHKSICPNRVDTTPCKNNIFGCLFVPKRWKELSAHEQNQCAYNPAVPENEAAIRKKVAGFKAGFDLLFKCLKEVRMKKSRNRSYWVPVNNNENFDCLELLISIDEATDISPAKLLLSVETHPRQKNIAEIRVLAYIKEVGELVPATIELEGDSGEMDLCHSGHPKYELITNLDEFSLFIHVKDTTTDNSLIV